MASSSTIFCARIRADAVARRSVLASGATLALAACVLLVQLPVAWHLRAAAAVLWCIGSGFEVWRCWRSQRDVAGFRLHADGSVDIAAPDGTVTSGRLASGTVALGNLAWLRCRGACGRVHAELISRNAQESDDWRRFRVICRHVAAC